VKRIEFTYNPKIVCVQLVKETMHKLNIPFNIVQDSSILLKEELNSDQMMTLADTLSPYSIKLVSNSKNSLIEMIKDCIKMVVADKNLRKKNLSVILTEKLGYSYSHLSTSFSSETFTSIENFHIFVKIEKAKELLSQGNLRVADVAFELDYSSVSHLSRQFKNVTGLTVSQYSKLMKHRANDN
jgi:AraC-like DNA-binding protein